MKIINIVIEIITAPFALLLRLSSNKKIIFIVGQTGFVLAISLLIVVLIVLFYYRDFIF